MFGSGRTALIISNEEMNDFMKIVKSVEESGLLIKGFSETVKTLLDQIRIFNAFLSLLQILKYQSIIKWT